MDNSEDPKLKEIMNQLSKFGFEFYARDENGIPLVKGPNDQVVEINVAINFVNKQIEEQKNSSGGSMEQPAMPENMDMAAKIESSMESKVEDSVENSAEKQEKREVSPNQQADDVPRAPIAAPKPVQKIKPYGDGFDPKSFNPSDLKSTLNFVEKNSKMSSKSSNKWLAEQFKKFIAEFNAGSNKS
ncbi:hypothetical protein KC678_03610 [Candidatus Dojkabacteria bacterium]|uniref:Uncharacterized protein n=1 Tax=Candidatus Dojkabacteria bacterium TaxID=2099670 RepID=A0A955RGD4_9BACT|nr:hypothetical protein [Candidatus Dojkabacteria bacterium]